MKRVFVMILIFAFFSCCLCQNGDKSGNSVTVNGNGVVIHGIHGTNGGISVDSNGLQAHNNDGSVSIDKNGVHVHSNNTSNGNSSDNNDSNDGKKNVIHGVIPLLVVLLSSFFLL